MTEKPNLSGARKAGMLSEAAARFDRLARVLKDQQLSETHAGARIAPPDPNVPSPDEAWARKYMTQAIGPASVPQAGGAGATLPRLETMPGSRDFALAADAHMSVGAAAPREPSRDLSATTAGGIGAIIGRPLRKRSWLGRLLLGH